MSNENPSLYVGIPISCTCREGQSMEGNREEQSIATTTNTQAQPNIPSPAAAEHEAPSTVAEAPPSATHQPPNNQDASPDNSNPTEEPHPTSTQDAHASPASDFTMKSTQTREDKVHMLKTYIDS
eukprot:5490433-Ditylum_brightwellii.AAC.1